MSGDDELARRREALEAAIRSGARVTPEEALAWLSPAPAAPVAVAKPRYGATADAAWALYEAGFTPRVIASRLGITPAAASAALSRKRQALGIQAYPKMAAAQRARRGFAKGLAS